jgi:hypothetical protein
LYSAQKRTAHGRASFTARASESAGSCIRSSPCLNVPKCMAIAVETPSTRYARTASPADMWRGAITPRGLAGAIGSIARRSGPNRARISLKNWPKPVSPAK